MAKKKVTKDRSDDRHTTRMLAIRFPDHLSDAMRELAKKNYRTLTAEMRIAVERHLEAAGMWPPASSS